MKYEERLAAGWVEHWGAYLKTGDGAPCWWTGLGSEGGRSWERADKLTVPRHAFADLHAAMRWCLEIPSQNVTPRRFWTRKRPASPPPLKVGDEVLVRGKLERIGDDGTGLVAGTGRNCWFDLEKDIVRAAKEPQ